MLAVFRIMRKVSTVLSLEKASMYWNRLIRDYTYRYVEKIVKPVAKQYEGCASPGERPACGNCGCLTGISSRRTRRLR